MNRRKAILRFSMTVGGIGAAWGGYKWWTITKSPDMKFIEHHQDLIAALAETIIPATDSPGAREADVHSFIIKMIRHCTPRKEQNTFTDGLKNLQDYCSGEFNKPFEHCNATQQEATLLYFEQKGRPLRGIAGKAQLRYMGRSFFAILKDYTVEGYCTSQIGATKGLAYLYIPGSFQACIPLQPGQKSWATN